MYRTTTLGILAFFMTSPGMAQTTHELTTSGFQFIPDTLYMAPGDSIHLTLGVGHTCSQVGEATWDDNFAMPLIGFNFGPDVLEHMFSLDLPGTYWYVCETHVQTMGMKGVIIVSEGSGLHEESTTAISMHPDPANEDVYITWNSTTPASQIRLMDMTGHMVLTMRSDHGPMMALDTRSIASNVYVMQLIAADGTLLGSERLVIAHD